MMQKELFEPKILEKEASISKPPMPRPIVSAIISPREMDFADSHRSKPENDLRTHRSHNSLISQRSLAANGIKTGGDTIELASSI